MEKNKVTWFLEDGDFFDHFEPLKLEIERQGMEYICEKSIPEEILNEDNCVLFHGSLETAKKFHMGANNPVVYCSFPNFECSRYYAYFGKWILNSPYVMIPFSEMKRNKDFLFDSVGKDGLMFIRPSSGDKSFTGSVISFRTFEDDLEILGRKTSADSLVVASKPKRIMREWRMVVADRKVISCSLYSDLTTSLDYDYKPREIFELSERILCESQFQPDRIWTMDICETEEGFSLLEIGSFSCAGMYTDNFEKIVSEASRIALEDYLNPARGFRHPAHFFNE